MKFSQFAHYLSNLEKTSSRLEITRILAQVFKTVSVQEIDKVCYLSLGRLAPRYAGIELSMAEKMMIRAISAVLGVSSGQVTKDYKKSGDLGEVVLNHNPPAGGSKITVSQVHQKLLEIAKEGGERSQERKVNKMVELLKSVDGLSAKFLVRIPLQKLRLGFSDMTVLDSLSWSKTGDKSLRKPLENAFNVLADIGKIAAIFKTEGTEGIKKIKPEVGVPILPAKAERLKTPQEILEKMAGQCALEPKYDGLRVQVHIDKSKKLTVEEKINLNLFSQKPQFFVRIFSRNLENMTHMFPDIVTAAQKLTVKSSILDGEAIAFDPKNGKFLPFQETVQRKRKHGVAEKSKQLPLKVFCFDILNLDNESLLEKPFSERRKILERLLGKKTETILLTEQEVVTAPLEFEEFFKRVVNEGLEGLMAKKLDSIYQAGARNFNWVKFKAGMTKDLADTVDCVVMGYYVGLGKRTGFGLGAFLVGVPDKDKILTVSKIGTGLTDEQWREMYKRCQKLKVSDKPKEYEVHKNLFPDVWCRPALVVEIEADTITKSPIHTAGLALRFPRLKHFRDDKDPGQATSLKELKNLVK